MSNGNISQNEIDNELSVLEKPTLYKGKKLPLTELDDRAFEILLYSLFNQRLEEHDNSLDGKFDQVHLMSGVAEQGQDCILTFQGRRVGIIQCKQKNKNLSETEVAQEILKFVLYYLKDNSLIDDINNFTYFFAVSKGFSSNAAIFLSDFNNKVLTDSDKLKTWITEIIRKKEYKSLCDIKYDAIEKTLKTVLSSIKVEKLIPADIEVWIQRYVAIKEVFFSVETVIKESPSVKKINNKEINEFEKKYQKQVISRHKFISPPNFDTHKKIPIDDLFVTPRFLHCYEDNDKEKKSKEISMSNFIPKIFRTVILGDPGAGKTTFSNKVCYDLAHHPSKHNFAEKEVIPILIILRDYGVEKKNHHYSILEFTEIMVNSTYQIKPPQGAIEYLIEQGRVLVIFDGLDELLDTSYRQEISGDIEAFCERYQSVPVLITSRKVGYEQAPLDCQIFHTFSITSFNEKQIEDYVKKWFSFGIEIPNEKDRNQKISSFIKESEIVPDLRANPLMLALMCNIYRCENYIPKNISDVYEKCTVMLFERWDKGRNILVPLPFENHIRPAMAFLAHWIYSDEKRQSGVIEQQLIAASKEEYIHKKGFDDPDDAQKAAKEFIEFTRGRAWVFTDTGTTKEGEHLYQFTHRTFLEYFTAFYLNRIYDTPEELGKFLHPKIARQEWDVVTQLAYQIKNKNLEDAGDKLLTDILEQFNNNNNSVEKGNYLSFSARCLNFIIPSPNVVRLITSACIEYIIDWGKKHAQFEDDPPQPEDHLYRQRLNKSSIAIQPKELLHHLLISSDENRKTISDTLEKLLVERINGDNEEESILALEMSHLYFFDRPSNSREIFDFWQGVSENIFNSCSERIKEMSPKYFRACLLYFYSDKCDIGNIIKWHGLLRLFKSTQYIVFPNISATSIVGSLLVRRLFQAPNFSKPTDSIKQLNTNLEGIYPFLFQDTETLRFIHFERSVSINISWFLRESSTKIERVDENPLKLSSEAFFVAFILIALCLESKTDRGLIKNIKDNTSYFFDYIRWTLLARFMSVEYNNIQAELDKCQFTNQQKDFIWKWTRKEINLVKQREAEHRVSDKVS